MQARHSPTERRALLAEALRQRNLDAALISDPRHLYYFTGFAAGAGRYRVLHTGQSLPAFLCVGREGPSVLLLAASEVTNPVLGEGEIVVSRERFDGALYTYGDYQLTQRIVADPPFVAEELVEVLEESKSRGLNVGRWGIEEWSLSEVYRQAISAAFPGMEFVGLSGVLRAMRRVKGDDEIAHLREASARLDWAFGVAKRWATEGRTELDMYERVHHELAKRYGPTAVSGDLLSGSRTLEVIGGPTDRPFRNGDPVLLDLCTAYRQYWGRSARSFVVAPPSEGQMRVAHTLLRAKERAESLLKPGTKEKEIYAATSAALAEAGSSERLLHDAGHGVGLDVVEPPFFLPNADGELQEGVVCTLRLGNYETSTGGFRFGDLYLITSDGHERISRAPWDL